MLLDHQEPAVRSGSNTTEVIYPRRSASKHSVAKRLRLFARRDGRDAGPAAGPVYQSPGPRRTLRMRRIKHLWRRRRRRSRRLPTAAERPPGCHRLHALPARGEMSRFRQRESRPGVHPAAEIGLFLVHQLAEILQ